MVGMTGPANLGPLSVEVKRFQRTTQVIRGVRLSHDRDAVRVPVQLAEMFRRPRHVGNLRTGGMQRDDAGVGGGDYLAVDGETSENDLGVDIVRAKEGLEALSVRDTVGIGYHLMLSNNVHPDHDPSVAESVTTQRK